MRCRLDEIKKTGIRVIDRQHAQLVEAINRLGDALDAQNNFEELKETSDFLDNYIAIHLSTEEDLMLKYDFPGYAEHKKEHNIFTRIMFNLLKKCELEDSSIESAKTLHENLWNWFVNHVQETDMKYAPYIKEKMSPET